TVLPTANVSEVMPASRTVPTMLATVVRMTEEDDAATWIPGPRRPRRRRRDAAVAADGSRDRGRTAARHDRCGAEEAAGRCRPAGCRRCRRQLLRRAHRALPAPVAAHARGLGTQRRQR